MNKHIANNRIKQLRRTINLLLNDKDFNHREKLSARIAYLSINDLRNSLHRHLVKKKA